MLQKWNRMNFFQGNYILQNDRWLSVKDAAEYIGVSEKSIRRALKPGKNETLKTKKVGNMIRVLKSSLDQTSEIRLNGQWS